MTGDMASAITAGGSWVELFLKPLLILLSEYHLEHFCDATTRIRSRDAGS
jgi:hypothetical protein